MSVQAIIHDHTGLAQVAGELAAIAMKHGALRDDPRRVRAKSLRRGLVDYIRVVFNDIYSVKS